VEAVPVILDQLCLQFSRHVVLRLPPRLSIVKIVKSILHFLRPARAPGIFIRWIFP
jgi:hypothetical protein